MVCGESSYASEGWGQKCARSTADMAVRTTGEVIRELRNRLVISSALVLPLQRQAMIAVWDVFFGSW